MKIIYYFMLFRVAIIWFIDILCVDTSKRTQQFKDKRSKYYVVIIE